MGDATDMVTILAGELFKKSENLFVMGLHPSEVIKGYELACVKPLAELESESSLIWITFSQVVSANLSTSSLPSPFTQESLITALKPAIA
jgi:T-complex protein 1 subunit theta